MHPFVYSLTSYYHIREQRDIFGPQLWLPGCLATVFSQLYPDERLHFTSCARLTLSKSQTPSLSVQSCYTAHYYETLYFLSVHKTRLNQFYKLNLQLCCLIARREGPGFAWLLSTVQRLWTLTGTSKLAFGGNVSVNGCLCCTGMDWQPWTGYLQGGQILQVAL